MQASPKGIQARKRFQIKKRNARCPASAQRAASKPSDSIVERTRADSTSKRRSRSRICSRKMVMTGCALRFGAASAGQVLNERPKSREAIVRIDVMLDHVESEIVKATK